LGSSPRRLPPQQFPILGRVAQDGNDDDDAQSTQGVEECLRCKDVSSLRMLALPDLTGAFRAWRNAFLPMLMALDSSSENLLYQWLLQAFNARTAIEINHLRDESEGFPRFDRVFCSWFTKDLCLKGHFGTRT
jgi:hypothetical protein